MLMLVVFMEVPLLMGDDRGATSGGGYSRSDGFNRYLWCNVGVTT